MVIFENAVRTVEDIRWEIEGNGMLNAPLLLRHFLTHGNVQSRFFVLDAPTGYLHYFANERSVDKSGCRNGIALAELCAVSDQLKQLRLPNILLF